MRVKRKSKLEKDILNYKVYDNVLLNIVTSMFDFKNVPDTIPKEKIMLELLRGRACFFQNDKGDYLILKGDYMGEPNDYGYTKTFLANSSINTYEIPVTDCEVVNLNNLGNNEFFNILRFADMLTEIDISEKTLIKIARSSEIIGVSDSNTLKVVNEAIKKRELGEVGLVTDNDTLSKISGNDSVKAYKLSDPAQISNMIYLSQYSNEMRKRFFMYCGLALNYNGKLAQQSEAEVSENEAVAWVVPLMWYRNICEWIERVNKHFNLDIKVGFSNVWEIAYTKYKKSIEDTNNDNLVNDEDNIEGGSDNVSENNDNK